MITALGLFTFIMVMTTLNNGQKFTRMKKGIGLYFPVLNASHVIVFVFFSCFVFFFQGGGGSVFAGTKVFLQEKIFKRTLISTVHDVILENFQRQHFLCFWLCSKTESSFLVSCFADDHPMVVE